MKLSGYEKSQNNNITLKLDYNDLDSFDKVYISKVFTDTYIPEDILTLPNIVFGGTGFFYDKAPPLPDYIEHHMPDYNLYDEWVYGQLQNGGKRKDFEYYLDHSIGYLTRKCFRGCEFCVNRNYKKVELGSPLEEFYDTDRKYICLLDDNFLGYRDWKSLLTQLQNTNRRFQFKQGLDERILNEEKIIMLSQSKYYGDYIFAFDNIADKNLIMEKLKLWKQYNNKTTKFYVFCGFDRNDKWNHDFWVQDLKDTFERIKVLMNYGCLPYIMRFNRYEESPYVGTYINLARWCNQPNFFKKVSYRRFCEMNQEQVKKGVCSAMRYLVDLEHDYPEIAEKYFDLKYENLNNYNIK